MEDDSEQFSLRWNNFHSNLSSGFQELFEDKNLVDVTLACEGQYIQAHRAVLTVCSPYFKALFKVNPNNHPIIILKDVSFTDLKSILLFMYRGEVNVKQDDLNTFLKTAEVLKVKGLTGDDTKESSRNVSQLFQESQAPQVKRRKLTEPAKLSPPPPVPVPQPRDLGVAEPHQKIQFITIKNQKEEPEEFIDDEDNDNEHDFSAHEESLDLESQICLDSSGQLAVGQRGHMDAEGSSSHSSFQGPMRPSRPHQEGDNACCDFCQKRFSSSANLYKHIMRVHSTQRHTCPVCPKKFGALFDLNDHVRSKHPELPDTILKQISHEFKSGFAK
ncbi:modifier of mdg4-like isoform X1 [Neocloeon triangulifer]|uniref:modifier of mdg4-like isoform X1 n=1 Tax=Neocloeon triangulifer TaxID=2078957 RepID=UPI00286F01C4|nr:modifier of mdg4-like isoform X1 [Neocloeon triangulifer]